jgi:hypothetical protein
MLEIPAKAVFKSTLQRVPPGRENQGHSRIELERRLPAGVLLEFLHHSPAGSQRSSEAVQDAQDRTKIILICHSDKVAHQAVKKHGRKRIVPLFFWHVSR